MQAAPSLPSAAAIEALWRRLRDEDAFALTPEQLAAALRLLLHVQAAPGEAAVQRLQNMLRGVFAKSPAQAKQFDVRFRSVLNAPAPQAPPIAVAPADPGFARLRRYDLWVSRAVRVAVTVFIVAVLFPTAKILEEPRTIPREAPLPPPPAAPQIVTGGDDDARLTVRSFPRIIEAHEHYTRLPWWFGPMHWAGVLLPLLLAGVLAGWWWYRQRRTPSTDAFDLRERLDLLELAPGGREVWSDIDVRGKLRPLRDPPALPPLRLDISATIVATAARAGMFAPVWQDRSRRRGNVVLIEQASLFDHLAHLFVRGVQSLRVDHIEIELYGFMGDLGALLPEAGDRRPHGLDILTARSRSERLIIIGTGAHLVDLFRGRVGGAMEDSLLQWPYRYLLSTRPVRGWGVTETLLLKSGFSLGTATPRGLVALARAVEGTVESPGLLDVQVEVSG